MTRSIFLFKAYSSLLWVSVAAGPLPYEKGERAGTGPLILL